MTAQEFNDKVKTVKIKDLPLLFRTTDQKTLEVKGMFYGIENDGAVAHPEVGEEPNCVIVQLA